MVCVWRQVGLMVQGMLQTGESYQMENSSEVEYTGLEGFNPSMLKTS